jgi:hypothetical protein
MEQATYVHLYCDFECEDWVTLCSAGKIELKLWYSRDCFLTLIVLTLIKHAHCSVILIWNTVHSSASLCLCIQIITMEQSPWEANNFLTGQEPLHLWWDWKVHCHVIKILQQDPILKSWMLYVTYCDMLVFLMRGCLYPAPRWSWVLSDVARHIWCDS